MFSTTNRKARIHKRILISTCSDLHNHPAIKFRWSALKVYPGFFCVLPDPPLFPVPCSLKINQAHWVLLSLLRKWNSFPYSFPCKSKLGSHAFSYVILPCVNRCFCISLLSGTAGDSLGYHRNSAFSTKDRDNDNSSGNCAAAYKGGWWFNSCVIANLNGYYYHGPHSSDHDGVNWRSWMGRKYSAKRAEMKIRPVDF